MFAKNSPLAIGIREFPVTLLLIGICVLLYVWQVITGVDANTPSSQDLIYWGANFAPYTLYHDSWRMVSSLFLHIGFLHLLLNMFALYYFGQIAEPKFGSVNFLLLFLLSGIGGNLLNNTLELKQILSNDYPMMSAGASGGIMGIGMALLMVALNGAHIKGKPPYAIAMLIMMGVNISYGFFVKGIDNAGHVGGALTGGLLAISYIWQYRDKKPVPASLSDSVALSTSRPSFFKRHYIVIIATMLISLLFIRIYWQLHQIFMSLIEIQLSQINI